MDNYAIFSLNLEFLDAQAEYHSPLVTPIRLVFTDDQPNTNGMGIKQEEFPQLLKSMKHMPIKANFSTEFGALGGHDKSIPIGLIKKGEQQGNKVIAEGAIWKEECPELIDYFKQSYAVGS